MYESEMARAALTTLIENSMPTSSAQALTNARRPEGSTNAAVRPRQCFQETSVQGSTTGRSLLETAMADGLDTLQGVSTPATQLADIFLSATELSLPAAPGGITLAT